MAAPAVRFEATVAFTFAFRSERGWLHPRWTGTGDHDALERPITTARNARSRCSGTGDHDAVDGRSRWAVTHRSDKRTVVLGAAAARKAGELIEGPVGLGRDHHWRHELLQL